MPNHVGNTELVEYGIKNEDSNYRAHVCPKAQRVYVYDTFSGVDAIESGNHELVEAKQDCIACFMDTGCEICGGSGKVVTARGYKVPPIAINGIRELELNVQWWRWIDFHPQDSLSEKGVKALRLICAMLKRGRFPLKCLPKEITAHDLQIKGMDIWVKTVAKIQVKCDYPGGRLELGGTGNLFIQIEECNPFRIH